MRRQFLLLAALVSRANGQAPGQQTLARYIIYNASTELTPASLPSAGLPSYSSLMSNEAVTTVTASACTAGYYSPDDAQTCTACPAGKYSTTVTATSAQTCISCESGKYSGTVGAGSSATCINCPNGTYFDGTGGTNSGVCLACPGNASSYPGSKLLEACVCNAGFSGANGGACTACNVSVWCLYGQANPCPPHSRSLAMSSSLGDCRCQAGYYGDTTMGGPDLTICQVRTRTCFGYLV
jgi:hypothetical protein